MLSFGVESHIDFKCKDYISFYDGGSANFPLLGRYCGYILPPNHLSSGNQVLIRFKSDNYLSRKGFEITYESVPNNGDIDSEIISTSNISSSDETEGGKY